MANVLITGADGFIGSHLTERLVRDGHSVSAFCWYNSLGSLGWLDHSPAEVQSEIRPILGDIRDSYILDSATRGVDIIFHLAALIGIPYSYEAPDSYISTNVHGTHNLLRAARNADVGCFVQASTSEVYGSAQFIPISEDHPLVGQSPYAASKIAADQLALSYHFSFNLPVTVLRPFNTFGPRQSQRAVIPTIIHQLLSGQGVVHLGAVHTTRDFTYVEDTVNGFVCAASADHARGATINLGTGFEISIADTAREIAALMGTELKLEPQDPQRLRPASSEVDRLCSDNSRARTTLKWEPQFHQKDGLRTGLMATIDWFRSNRANSSAYSSNYVI